MRRTVSFFLGVVSGAIVGAVVALLLAPHSGQEFQNEMRSRVQALIEDGRRAAAARRAELEAQLEAFKRGSPVVIEPAAEQTKA